MANPLENDTLLRRYLLGQIENELELNLVEERLLSDEEYLEELNVMESALIDEYVLGELKGAELENFKRLFLNIPERIEKINFTFALRKYAENEAKKESRASVFEKLRFSPKMALSFIAVILIVGFIIWAIIPRQNSNDDIKQEIASLYKRPVQERIPGLPYSQFIVVRGAEETPKTRQTGPGRAIELRLLEEIKTKPTAESCNLLGIYYLAEKRFDDAIGQFETGLRINPAGIEALTNLGTAYLEKAKSTDENKTVNLQKSLDEFNKALESDDRHIEALFNKALVFQEMKQREKAVETWKLYLEKDKDSGWANDARQNLKNLEN